MTDTHNLALVRAWTLTIFGCIAIAVGLIRKDAPAITIGFATLGAEPTTRAAINGG